MPILKLKDGSSIGYDLQGDGPPLVFMHGATYNRSMWLPVVDRLKESYTCLSLDLPGHGESSDPISYDREILLKDLHEFISEFSIEKPVMIGHSLSGLFVPFYSSLFPVSGIITSDQRFRASGFIAQLQSKRDELKGPEFPKIWRVFEERLRIDLVPEERRYLVQGKNSRPEQHVMLGYWSQFLDTPLQETQDQLDNAIRQIKCPLTAIFGGELDTEYRTWLDNLNHRWKLVVFQNAGHFPHLVDPERFAKEVEEIAKKST